MAQDGMQKVAWQVGDSRYPMAIRRAIQMASRLEF
jgi:hypothetical protein